MIAAYHGPDKFREGVRSYTLAHRYCNATSARFLLLPGQGRRRSPHYRCDAELHRPAGRSTGYVSGTKGHYTVSQSRYAPLGVEVPATRWGVPLCMRQGETRKCQLLTQASASFALGGSGELMPNAGGTGYYRFELPEGDWSQLIATADTLGAAEAMAVADSLNASFRAGRASPEQLIALAAKLAVNPDSYAAGSAFSALGSLRRTGFFDDQATATYRKWVGGFARADYARLGFDPKAGVYSKEDPETIQRRERMVGDLLLAKDSEITSALAGAASAYIGGDQAALDPAYMGEAFKAYIAKGGLPVAKTLTDKALSSEDPVFRPAALRAVASSGDGEIAKWVLGDLGDDRMRATERLYMALGIAATQQTQDMGYEWLTQNLDHLLNGASGIFLARAVPGVMGGFCSVDKADDIAKRFRPVFANTPGALELERTIERVRDCAALKAARASEVNAAVKKL